MIEEIVHIKQALWHNINYVIESTTAWCLVGFSHVVGLQVSHPIVLDYLPYVQLASLFLASVASVLTIYKIKKDLKK